MTDEAKKHSLWEWAKNIGALVGAILLVLQLFHWLSSLGNDLHATIRSYEFRMPEAVIDGSVQQASWFMAHAFQTLIRQNNATLTNNQTRLADSGIAQADARAVDSAVTNVVLQMADLIKSQGARLSGVVLVAIENTGNGPLKSVSLKMPYAVMATIEYETGAVTNLSNLSGIIPIGDVNSKEKLKVTSFTTMPPGGISFKEDVFLRHSSGIGSISFLESVGNPWKWMASKWNFLGLFGSLCLLMLFGGLAMSFWSLAKFWLVTKAGTEGNQTKP
jgi:hypothetical protein